MIKGSYHWDFCLIIFSLLYPWIGYVLEVISYFSPCSVLSPTSTSWNHISGSKQGFFTWWGIICKVICI